MDIFNHDTQKYIEQIKSKHWDKKIGFTCSTFDLLHAGHMIMLEDAKKQCDILVIALQTDPTIDRIQKNKPIQSYEEREIMISGIKYIDHIIKYATENDLYNILLSLVPDVRILGSDWRGKNYTGYNLEIPIYWHERTHNWSTTELRKRVTKQSQHLIVDSMPDIPSSLFK